MPCALLPLPYRTLLRHTLRVECSLLNALTQLAYCPWYLSVKHSRGDYSPELPTEVGVKTALTVHV